MSAGSSIDPELLDRALQLSGEQTNEAAIAKALREFVARRERSAKLEWAARDAASVAERDRAYLKRFTDLYFDALATHDASKLPVSSSVKFTETGRQMKLGEGFWQTAGTTTYRLEIFDPETGGAAVHALVMESGEPVSFLLRLKVENQTISEVETVVARKEDAGPAWAPETLIAPPPLFTRTIRPAERNSRLELMAAADAYFRALETNGTFEYAPAPLLPDTDRIENGFQTTNMPVGGIRSLTTAEQFDKGLFKDARVYDRRYPVVDVERGVVLAIVRFGIKSSPADTANGSASSWARFSPFVCELFAVNGGKIRQIQAAIVNATVNTPTGWQ